MLFIYKLMFLSIILLNSSRTKRKKSFSTSFCYTYPFFHIEDYIDIVLLNLDFSALFNEWIGADSFPSFHNFVICTLIF
uniref:Uncharacterized protein n=1 Tax=Arundo donax TaxID=35708 RepID=A0A0A9EFE3_ARUDO